MICLEQLRKTAKDLRLVEDAAETLAAFPEYRSEWKVLNG
jgi:hypothetical protein